MKLLALIAFLPLCSFSQKLEENKIDDFTHISIKRTSWEPLVKRLGANMMIHVRSSKIDSSLELGVKMMGVTGSMSDGANLMLKLDNDSIVTLKNLKLELPCIGCGAIGFNGSAGLGLDLHFWIPKDAAAMLSSHRLKKVRIYLLDGYVEDDVKDKTGDIVQRELLLLQ